MALHHYRDAEYGDWYLIEDGESPRRWALPRRGEFSGPYPMHLSAEDLRKAIPSGDYPRNTFSIRIGASPKPSPRNWIENGNWRQSPAKWSKSREWFHVPLGAATGLLMLLALFPSVPTYAPVALILGLVHLFLRYEETESADILDRPYRDIAGYKGGLFVSSAAATAIVGIVNLFL